MNRSRFVVSAVAAAGATFLRTSALASVREGASDSLAALVETLLPIGEPAFPLKSSTQLLGRIETLFHLSKSVQFNASLTSFSSLAAFAAGSPELFALEESLVQDVDAQGALQADRRLLAAAGLPAQRRFANLTPLQRNAYVRLWSQSAFCARRRFYCSIRAVVFASFYSTQEAWKAIRYAGPLLHKPYSN